MKPIIAVVFTALTACQSSESTYPPVTTTSARIEARRREAVPPSPPPTMGQMPNMATPLPELPSDTTATIPDTTNPPPGTSVTETVMPTMNKRDERIEKSLRSAIASDNTLSPEAKQVEVIVKDRKIILKGQAHTERERMDIDTKARATDDVIDVDDQIQLVP
ncbi:MAG TPA: BON domain-containing protein [Polyangiaceae bacterium]|jgi:hypothetical protein